MLAISVDTPFALKAFANEQRLNFPLLSDFNKEVIRAYDVFDPDMVGLKGIAKRSPSSKIVMLSGLLTGGGHAPPGAVRSIEKVSSPSSLVDELLQVSARLVVNRAAYRLEVEELLPLLEKLG